VRTIDGVVGVFTPVAAQGNDSPEALTNLQVIVDRLIREIGDLRQRNLDLQSRIDQLLAPGKSPDDLASALQRTVDRLANELASLSNPVSNFAVKDFRLETSLTVAITQLGTLEYRLLQPGSNVDPNAISKLTLSLAPIEKQEQRGTLSQLLFQPNKELAVLGMNADLRQTFEQNHIFTIGEFRSAVMRAQVRTFLIASERTTQRELALLQARAELVLLAGVDRNIADTLIAANIDSLQALARTTPEGLLLILRDVNKTQLAQWIAAAQTFTGIDPAVQPHHVVSVATHPPNLFVRLEPDAGYARTSIVRQLPANQPLKIRAVNPQLREDGVGHVLAGWSTGGVTAATTVQSLGDVAATANFGVACYSVIAATVSPGGKVVLSPAIGGVAGFPANCYAPGTNVQVVVTEEDGFSLKGLTIVAEGTTRSVTTLRTSLVVNGPVLARATFVPRPGTVSTIFPPVAAEIGFHSRVFFTPLTPAPGFDVRVTAVKFETTGGSGTVTLLSTLPIVFGDLPANGKSSEQQLAYDIPSTVETFNIFLTVQVKNANGDVFTDQRSIGHRRPGAAG
jgi:hypothetical protein